MPPESAIPTAGSQSAVEERLQRDRAIPGDVMSGVDEGNPPAPGRGQERLPGRAMRA